MYPVRLNKYLAQQGVCSRREADTLISSGVVTINGEPVILGVRVQEGDEVKVGDRSIAVLDRKIYLKLHKPRGYLTTTDLREADNVMTLIDLEERVFPVGRLDKYTSGLLLFTNDGAIVNRILKGRYGHEKEYLVKVDRPFGKDFIGKMTTGGVALDGYPTLPCTLERVGKRTFRLTLTEGRNRQVRRMCQELDFRVTELRRVRVMNIGLGDMKPGKWQMLSEEELRALFQLLEKSVEAGSEEEKTVTIDSALRKPVTTES